MSIALPILDLTGAGVGQQFTISFANVGISAGGISANPAFLKNKPCVKIHNDSGCGLFLIFKDEQDSDHIPPGAWRVYQIMPGESQMILTVEYTMQNPPASKFTSTYYFPGEYIDQVGTLGNSPTGGVTQTTSIQTLSNETSAGLILVIDIGQSGNQNLIQVNNDGTMTLLVLRGGVAHQALKIQSSGNSVLLVQANDTAEVLGNLLIDGTLSNAAGPIGGLQRISPYIFLNNSPFSAGATGTFQITGNGGIPANATWVLITAFCVFTATGGFISMGRQGDALSTASNGSLIGQAQGGTDQVAGTVLVPLNLANGKIDVYTSQAGNSFTGSVLGYIA